MYDILIIGAGPAGMTAGIYAARKHFKTLVLSRDIGGQMVVSGDIENYPGYTLMDGPGLTGHFRHHVETLKDFLELKEGKEVVSLEKNITTFEAQDRHGSSYYARAVIIATGRVPKHLGIAGEKEFFGKGVSVCATCDAPLYKDKTVAVIGGGNSALDALRSLAKVARRVYSVNIQSDFSGDAILKTRVQSQSNITFFSEAAAEEIIGQQRVSAVRIQDRSGTTQELSVDGVFVEIGWTPETDFDHLTKKNSKGEIMVDNNLQTNVPGLFAAGDVNDAAGEQIIIAAGEGAKAALAAASYLHSAS